MLRRLSTGLSSFRAWSLVVEEVAVWFYWKMRNWWWRGLVVVAVKILLLLYNGRFLLSKRHECKMTCSLLL